MLWKLLYVAACVVVPVAWGLIVYWLSNRVDEWLSRRNGPKAAAEEMEYHI